MATVMYFPFETLTRNLIPHLSTPSNYYLKRLPPLSKEYEILAAAITARFVGDASFFAYNGEEAEPEDPDAPPVERFRELHRLSYIVQVKKSFFYNILPLFDVLFHFVFDL